MRLGAEVMRHEGNLGYGAAIRSLFRRARGFNVNFSALSMRLRFMCCAGFKIF